MAVPVVMPKLGNSVESSIIVTWRKTKGERVEQGEILCEVETDKAMIEVESPASGIVLNTFFQAGDDVPVMTPIAMIGELGEDVESLRPTQPNVAVNNAAKARSSEPVVAETNQISLPILTQAISPRARNLAHKNGINTAGISGTGPGGRIIESDIRVGINALRRLTPLARSMVEKGDFVAPQLGSGIGGRITTKDLQPSVASSPVQAQCL